MSSKDDFRIDTPCVSHHQLHQWLEIFLGLRIPSVRVCPNHSAPFEYLKKAYFEPSADQIVWAPRGGGKTRMAAAATLLDLLHKPGASVRILGGSLEQSLRTWEHLLPDIERLAPHLLIEKKSRSRRIDMIHSGSAAVLTQSQKAVRGLRVQKLRCDEVELFDRDVLEAAQLVTRSIEGARGSIDLISTLHEPFGLMSEIVDSASAKKLHIVRWCLLEVLERCELERDCDTCPLWDDCGGVAKTKCSGFVKIDDAIAMKHRVSRLTWDSEILCKRPLQRGAVFPTFDPKLHVCGEVMMGPSTLCLGIDFGYHNPFACLWIRSDGRSFHVIDEHVQSEMLIEAHVQAIRSRRHGAIDQIYCDPAGNSRSDQTGKSSVAVLKSEGFRVCTRGSRIVDGLELIRANLQSAAGDVRLFIHPRCRILIRAMQAYHYPPGGGELPLKDGVHDHPIDALRYYFICRDVQAATTRVY